MPNYFIENANIKNENIILSLNIQFSIYILEKLAEK